MGGFTKRGTLNKGPPSHDAGKDASAERGEGVQGEVWNIGEGQIYRVRNFEKRATNRIIRKDQIRLERIKRHTKRQNSQDKGPPSNDAGKAASPERDASRI